MGLMDMDFLDDVRRMNKRQVCTCSKLHCVFLSFDESWRAIVIFGSEPFFHFNRQMNALFETSYKILKGIRKAEKN